MLCCSRICATQQHACSEFIVTSKSSQSILAREVCSLDTWSCMQCCLNVQGFSQFKCLNAFAATRRHLILCFHTSTFVSMPVCTCVEHAGSAGYTVCGIHTYSHCNSIAILCPWGPGSSQPHVSLQPSCVLEHLFDSSENLRAIRTGTHADGGN
jgi:hypothetical protein